MRENGVEREEASEQKTQMQVSEQTSVVSTYGHLFEAMSVTEATPANVVQALRNRWRRRHYLAQFSTQPEGMPFSPIDPQDSTHSVILLSVILLSPPDMVAELDRQGRWRRRQRIVEEDGPQPYSVAFYQEYLRRHALPPWFLRPGHISMLEDDAEARLLNVEVPAQIQTSSSLDDWFPVQPATPGAHVEAYEVVLCNVERQYLGRRFPAVLAGVPSTAYVEPSGHVVLRSTRPADSRRDVSLVMVTAEQWFVESPSQVRASYVVQAGIKPTAPTETQMRDARRRLFDAHIADGGIVNPLEIPAGQGQWEWLGSTDEQAARTNGFQSMDNIVAARGDGALSLNYERRDFPSIVFYPDPELLNPERQPEGPGRWAFLTSNGPDSDAGFAALNLGGAHGLPNKPTASQIFRLRQQYRARPSREDLTADLRLVWIQSEEPGDDEGVDPALSELEDDDEPAAGELDNTRDDVEEAGPGFLGEGVNPSDFDSTNGDPGGDHDQTAMRLKPRYFTCKIWLGSKKEIITLDRAHVQKGIDEPHKTWSYSHKGWQQYKRHAQLDWNDPHQLRQLQKWRDQIARRSGWPSLRQGHREMYSQEEKRWLAKEVTSRLDAGEERDVVAIHRAFKERFGAGGSQRTESAIASAVLRIRKKHERTGNLKFAGESSPVADAEGQGQKEEAQKGKRQKREDDGWDGEPNANIDNDGGDFDCNDGTLAAGDEDAGVE